MVTTVLTSCGRLDLLERTIDSFFKCLDYPVERFILIDDSGDPEVHEQIRKNYSQFDLILNEENIGLIKSIDKAYSKVETPFIFHLEDDWEFNRSGFMSKSIKILKANPTIMQVWLRSDKNPNGHPIEPEVFLAEDVEFKLVGTYQHSVWHGFTFNPGLRRKKEYDLIAPYDEIHLDENRGIGVQENHIGRVLFEQYGFRAATLLDEYCVHIGGHNRTYADPSKQNK